jgi:hypothetical protein
MPTPTRPPASQAEAWKRLWRVLLAPADNPPKKEATGDQPTAGVEGQRAGVDLHE